MTGIQSCDFRRLFEKSKKVGTFLRQEELIIAAEYFGKTFLFSLTKSLLKIYFYFTLAVHSQQIGGDMSTAIMKAVKEETSSFFQNFEKIAIKNTDANLNKKVYEYVKEGEFASALETIEDWKNQPSRLENSLLYAENEKTAFHLLIEMEATSKSKELLSEIVKKAKELGIEKHIRCAQPFVVALKKRPENGHFDYLLVKHNKFLTPYQVETCLDILCMHNDGKRTGELLKELTILDRNKVVEKRIFSVIDSNQDRVFRVFVRMVSILEFRRKGDTVLHCLAMQNRGFLLFTFTGAKLEEACSLLEVQNSAKRTALQVAASKNHAECVKVLLEMGANFRVQTEEGMVPSELAFKFLCLRSRAQVLLDKANQGFFKIREELSNKLRTQTIQRRTLCLFSSLRNENIDNAILLINTHNNELDRSMRDPDSNVSAPVMAVQMNSLNLLKCLERNGWNLEKDYSEMIFSAVKDKKYKIASFLLDKHKEFDLNSVNEEGKTLLQLLVEGGGIKLARRLVGPEFKFRFNAQAQNQLVRAFITSMEQTVALK